MMKSSDISLNVIMHAVEGGFARPPGIKKVMGCMYLRDFKGILLGLLLALQNPWLITYLYNQLPAIWQVTIYLILDILWEDRRWG